MELSFQLKMAHAQAPIKNVSIIKLLEAIFPDQLIRHYFLSYASKAIVSPELLLNVPCIWFGKSHGKTLLKDMIQYCMSNPNQLNVSHDTKSTTQSNHINLLILNVPPERPCDPLPKKLMMIPFVSDIKWSIDFKHLNIFKQEFKELVKGYHTNKDKETFFVWPASVKQMIDKEWRSIH